MCQFQSDKVQGTLELAQEEHGLWCYYYYQQRSRQTSKSEEILMRNAGHCTRLPPALRSHLGKIQTIIFFTIMSYAATCSKQPLSPLPWMVAWDRFDCTHRHRAKYESNIEDA